MTMMMTLMTMTPPRFFPSTRRRLCPLVQRPLRLKLSEGDPWPRVMYELNEVDIYKLCVPCLREVRHAGSSQEAVYRAAN
jgi:hypothetical protein